jgi:hypothetical protein
MAEEYPRVFCKSIATNKRILLELGVGSYLAGGGRHFCMFLFCAFYIVNSSTSTSVATRLYLCSVDALESSLMLKHGVQMQRLHANVHGLHKLIHNRLK